MSDEINGPPQNQKIYANIPIEKQARCSSMVECRLWIIPHSGPIEVFFVPASAPQLV